MSKGRHTGIEELKGEQSFI